MGVCGRALRVAAGAPRTALRLLGVVPLRVRSRALPGTLRLPLTPRLGVDGALGPQPTLWVGLTLAGTPFAVLRALAFRRNPHAKGTRPSSLLLRHRDT